MPAAFGPQPNIEQPNMEQLNNKQPATKTTRN